MKQAEHLAVLTCMLSLFSRVPLFVTLWTIACQAPLSMGFSRQESWSVPPQGISLTQGRNLHLLGVSCIGRRALYH